MTKTSRILLYAVASYFCAALILQEAQAQSCYVYCSPFSATTCDIDDFNNFNNYDPSDAGESDSGEDAGGPPQLPPHAVCCHPGAEDGCGPDPCAPGRNVGDPVDALSGAAWLIVEDIRLPLPAGPAFEMSRAYSTAWAQGSGGYEQIGTLGPGWSHTYDTHLDLSGTSPAARITIRYANTRSEVYYRSSSGNDYFSQHPGKRFYWSPNDSIYVLEFSDSSKEIFDSSGEQIRRIGADGSEFILYRAGESGTDCATPSVTHPSGSICYIESEFGNRLWLHHAADPLRLTKISLDAAGDDPLAVYQYSADGYLIQATAKGVTTKYEYDYIDVRYENSTDFNVSLLTAVLDADDIVQESFTYSTALGTRSRVVAHETQTDWYEFNYDLNELKTVITSSEGDTLMQWQEGRVTSTCNLDASGNCDLTRRFEYTYSTIAPYSLICEKTPDGYTRRQTDALGREIRSQSGLASCSAAFSDAAIDTAYVANSNKIAEETRPSLDADAPTGFRARTIWDYSSSTSCTGTACLDPDTYNTGTLTAQLQRLIRIGRTYQNIQKTWETRIEKTEYTYNAYGQLTNISGPGNEDLDLIYYSTTLPTADAGRLHQVKQGNTVLMQYADYNQLGQPETLTDESGVALYLEYDAGGRVTSSQRQGGQATTYTYAKGEIAEIQLPLGNKIKWNYDVKGRVQNIRMISSGGDVVEEVAYVRRDAGSQGAGMSDGRISAEIYSVNGTAARKTLYEYDERGRRSTIQKIEDYGGFAEIPKTYQISKFDEHHRVIGVANARHLEQNYFSNYQTSKNIEHVYDALGQLAQIKRLVGQTWTKVGEFDYDLHGNTVEIIDGRGLSSQYSYDDFGRLIRVDLPDSEERVYVYDVSGNLIQEKTPDGRLITRTYDTRNRLTALSSNGISEIFSYGTQAPAGMIDCATNAALPAANGGGRLTQVTDGGGTIYFGYDANGARAYEARLKTGASCARTIRWTYDANAQLTSIRYPSGHEVEFVYADVANIRHLPREVNLKVGSSTTALAQDIEFAAGDVTDYLAGNDLVWKLARDYSGSPKSMQVTTNGPISPDEIDPRTLYGRSYATDLSGSPTEYKNDLTFSTQLFSYDLAFGYLASSEIDSTLQEFTYSLAGDRLGEGDLTYNYATGTHRLSSVTDKANAAQRQYTYSPSGSVWTIKDGDGLRTLCYDAKDQMRRFVGKSGEIFDQIYDYNHRRIAMIGPVNDYRVDYRFDGAQLMEEQRDQSFTSVYPRPTTEYVWLAGRPIAALKSNENANGTYSAPTITYLFSGHLNEVLLETDSEGEFLYAHKYEPFGKQNLFESKEVSLGAPNPLVDYGSGMMMSQIGGPSDAHGIKIHFNQISMSCGMVMIFDSQDNIVETITSSTTNHWSPIVLGSSAMVIYYDATGSCPSMPTVTMTEAVAVYQGSHEYVRIGYPGQYQEPETGLIENWWRYYEPETGRYLGEESLSRVPNGIKYYSFIGFRTNEYGYAFENPVKYRDFTGKDVWIEASVDGEPYFHISLSIGDPTGVHDSYSFGTDVINSSFIDLLLGRTEGSIYKDASAQGKIDFSHYLKTTSEEDSLFKRELDLLIEKNEKSRYEWYNNNCRKWTFEKFDEISKRVDKMKSKNGRGMIPLNIPSLIFDINRIYSTNKRFDQP